MLRVFKPLAVSIVCLSLLQGLLVSMAMAQAKQGPPLYDNSDSTGRKKTTDFMENNGAGSMGDVKTRIKEQINEGKATLYTDQYSKVETFVNQVQSNVKAGKADPMKKIDRGYDTPTDFHALDKSLIDQYLDQCWDALELQDNKCICHNYVTGPGNVIISGAPTIEPITEYWYPVSKVENVPTPLETGYIPKSDISTQVTKLDSYFPSPYKDWVNFAANRMIQNSKSYWQKNYSSVYTMPSPAPSISITDDLIQKARSVTTAGGKDAHYRSMFPDNYSGMENEFHVMPEPYGRNDLYWKSRISKKVCHWNLDYGGYDSSGGDLKLDLKAMYYSDLPDYGTVTMKVGGRQVNGVKSFEAVRNSTQLDLMLKGKSQVRPNVQYDHADLFNGGGLDSKEVYKAFIDNGGYIATYMTQNNGRNEDPMWCPENYMDTTYKYITHEKGRTPDDMLKSLWTKKTSTNQDFQKSGGFLASGCMRKNLGEWVPTRNTTQTIYHSQAAMVGTMRGLKLAFYYYCSEQWTKGGASPNPKCQQPGQTQERFGDSYGIEPCYFAKVQEGEILGSGREIRGIIPDGMYYDFEPNIYTFAGYSHMTTTVDKDVYWILRCQGGGICPYAADKVQWSTSGAMPKKCIGLQKYFNELEKTSKGTDQSAGGGPGPSTQGGANWDAGMPNLTELPRDQATKSDPQNTAIEWRFFRTCPKETLNKQYIKIVGTNTAVCCEQCPCDPPPPGCPSNCIPQKKL